MSEEKLTRAAIVTGGSRGIGRAVCVALAKQGCNVVVNYCHGAEPAEQTAALCRAEGVQAVTVQADVSTAEGCKALFDAAAEAFGRVDVLVNNAGITRDNLILRLTEQDFDAVLDTNLKSAFLCCKEAARRMVRQRYGRIVNLSSVVALRGNAGQTNYAASKAGLIGLTKSLARELAARNVTVNAVAPGFIDTDMTAVLPEEVRAQGQAVLDRFPTAAAEAYHLESGFEAGGIALLRYPGFVCEAIWSKVCRQASPTTFMGEDGSILLDDINHIRRIWLVRRNGEIVELPYREKLPNNMMYELREFAGYIASGTQPEKRNRDSVITASVIEQARRQTGTLFDGE